MALLPLGIVLTNAPSLAALAPHLAALPAPRVLKVIPGWGLDSGWNAPTRTGTARLADILIARTGGGDPSSGQEMPLPDAIANEVDPWYEARDPAKPFYIQIGNEPLDRPQSTEQYAWTWKYFFDEAVTLCRRRFPHAQIMAPGHLINHPIRLGSHTDGNTRWLQILAESYRQCDALGAHAYTAEQLDRAARLLRTHVSGQLPIWLTEYNLNEALPPAVRGAALADLLRDTTYAGVTLYHLAVKSGTDPMHFNKNYSLDVPTLQAFGAAMTTPSAPLSAAPIWDIDLSSELAALPKRPTARTLGERTVADAGIIVHYGGRKATSPRTRSHELNVLRSYARHHLNRNWESDPKRSPIYANTIMYRWSVLSDGAIVLLVRNPLRFWQANNITVNDTFEAVVLPLGEGQSLTPAQAASLTRLLDHLRGQRLPRERVFGHCEVPLRSGMPTAFPSYRLQPRQSECPGATIHAWIVAYRTTDIWAAWGTTYPLVSDQRGWAIPQRWLREGDLGAAQSHELYRPDGGSSVQYFAHGAILWWRQGNRTEVVR